MVLLGSLNKGQNSREGLDGISISSHHQVGETNIVVGGNVAGDDSGEESLLVKLNVIHHLKGQGVIS